MNLDEILINFTHLLVISKSLKVHSKAMKNLNTVSKPLINKILKVTVNTGSIPQPWQVPQQSLLSAQK